MLAVDWSLFFSSSVTLVYSIQMTKDRPIGPNQTFSWGRSRHHHIVAQSPLHNSKRTPLARALNVNSEEEKSQFSANNSLYLENGTMVIKPIDISTEWLLYGTLVLNVIS